MQLHYAHTRPSNGPLSETTRVGRYQKGKPVWILLKQETVSGSDISWAICKSAPHNRQITTQFIIGRMPFLPPNQQRQSTEGRDFDIDTLAVVQLSILLYLLCLHQAKLLRVNPLQFLHENQYRTMQCSLLDNWCNC